MMRVGLVRNVIGLCAVALGVVVTSGVAKANFT